MNSKYKKFIKFVCTSGIGWVIDFALYSVLTYVFDIPVKYANFISAVPAVTFVFVVSTKKTFDNSASKIKLRYKYLAYILYQVILVSVVSVFAEFLSNRFAVLFGMGFDVLIPYSKLAAKCVVTCITLVCNYLVMKFIIEKL